MPQNTTILNRIAPTVWGCLAVVYFLLATGGCKSKDEYHIAPAIMENILFDVSLAESYAGMTQNEVYGGGIKNMDSLARYYATILAKYSITKEQYITSIRWYENHPALLDTIYTHLTDRSTLLQSQLYKERDAQNAEKK